MEILVVLFAVLTVSFGLAYVSAIFFLRKVTQVLKELVLARSELQKAESDFLTFRNSTVDPDVHTKNFIKFLSDSRDWAFEYIENVQKGIKKFVSEVNPQFEYFNKQEKLENGILSVSDFTIKKIHKEIQELKKFLPEEDFDRR